MQEIDIVSSTEFQTWLASLPGLGYDRDWIRRNMPALEQQYNETGGAPMAPCPPAPARAVRDRYEEL
jgi:hypothetical protein